MDIFSMNSDACRTPRFSCWHRDPTSIAGVLHLSLLPEPLNSLRIPVVGSMLAAAREGMVALATTHLQHLHLCRAREGQESVHVLTASELPLFIGAVFLQANSLPVIVSLDRLHARST